MTHAKTNEPDSAISTDRVIGRYGGDTLGPTLVCITGLHGNEPAGVAAATRVLDYLHKHKPALRGEFVALRGNLTALSRRERYIDRDLNRQWTQERLAALAAPGDAPQSVEDREQIALNAAISREIEHAPGRFFLLDVHTTSSVSAPFVILHDSLRNRAFARALCAPLVLGLEESLEGTITDHFSERGGVCAAFECGRHDDAVSVELGEAALWLGIRAADMLDAGDIPHIAEMRARIHAAASGVPPVVEVLARHALERGDAYVMRPGFRNFDIVRRGQALGLHNGHDVAAAADSRVFMPLYQALGTEAFFLVQPVARFWLWLSGVVRRAGFSRIIGWLPGVRPHALRPRTFVVNPLIARIAVAEIFHLLGAREHESEHGRRVFSLRREE
ncbi:MAG: succinylglutamate desuccinylase/aspartoacylase family protein [Phycisphaerales bacterium]|nr:succinylglutamate desuccinylase/aspartoacylase family protein [Phycisphaerales bacterium]